MKYYLCKQKQLILDYECILCQSSNAGFTKCSSRTNLKRNKNVLIFYSALSPKLFILDFYNMYYRNYHTTFHIFINYHLQWRMISRMCLWPIWLLTEICREIQCGVLPSAINTVNAVKDRVFITSPLTSTIHSCILIPLYTLYHWK